MNRKMMWGILPVLACIVAWAAHAQSALSTESISPAAKQKLAHYEQLPLGFEPNVGQTSTQVQWLSRSPNYTLFLTGPDAVLQLSKVAPAAKPGGSPKIATTALRMILLGGNLASSSTGQEPQTGKVNYFTGNNSADWHRDVSLYGKVRFQQVYPGIDLAYYGHQGQLEYDFIVAPGADASSIRLRFDGATPQLAANGDLVLPVNGSEVRFHQPVVYQMNHGVRQPVAGRFTMARNHEVTIVLGAYDKTRELVIDPTLAYTGTFGTASESDTPAGMAVDSKGELIITGATLDLNFPATSGAYQTSCGPVSSTDTQNGVIRCAVGNESAMSSAYITKLSADGTALVYATYLHGITGWEKGAAVQADASGNAVVIGQTASADFPLVNAPAIPQMSLCQPAYPVSAPTTPAETCSGYFDGGGTEWTIQGPSGFVSKLSADGSSLLYSAFLGFSGTVYPQALALDSTGQMYILNQVNNADPNPPLNPSGEIYYPTTSTAFQTGGVGDYGTALTVLSADGQTIVYSTIFGETEPVANGCGSCLNGTVPTGVAVGQNGTVFIAGETTAGTLPVTAGTVQTTCVLAKPSECTDNAGYVAAFDITKSGAASLEWATYISGPDNPNTAVSTQLNAIATDADNNVYLTGYTTDGLFPITAGAYASTCPLDGRSGANFCDNAVFVSKLNSSGTAYDWSTFLAPTQGASSGANSNGIALDSKGNVYVYGDSGDLIVPAVNPLPQYPDGWYQPYPFLSVLDPKGSNLLFSSQVAPNNGVSSMHNGLALDSSGNIYMVGNTQGGQSLMVGSTTLTSWPTTKGTYSTAITGTGVIPFFVKVAALLSPTKTTLTATPATTVAGQDVKFAVTVAGTSQDTPAPTGTVTLTNTAVDPAATLGTVDLSAGAGSFTTSSLAVGSYTVVGTYSSDSVYDVSSSSAVTVTINNPAKATVALSVPPSAVFGSSVTFTATVSGSGGTPTGTVTFLDGATALGHATLASGKATFSTSSLAAGSHSITASYGGDSTFGTATSSASTINIASLATPAITLKVPASAVSGSSVTLSVTVTGSGATPTGSVTFLDGATTLKTASLASGAASYAISSLAVGSHSITAKYAGDGNYAAGVSAAQTIVISAPAADFSLSTSPASATITSGGSTTTTVSVKPSNGFASATSLTCSGLPANSTCTFSPASVTPGSGAVTSTLTIATNVSSASAALHGSSNGVLAQLSLAGSGAGLLALFLWPASFSRSRRRFQRHVGIRMLALFAFSMLAVYGLAGCGGGSKTSTTNTGPVTPAGTSTVTITAKGGSSSHTTTFTLTVQ